MEDLRQLFHEAFDEWLCDGYTVDCRYLAMQHGEDLRIIHALVALAPVLTSEVKFELNVGNLVAGQFRTRLLTREALRTWANDACDGTLRVREHVMTLGVDPPSSYYSEMTHPDKAVNNLHLRISSRERLPSPTTVELAQINASLRKQAPPFDGVVDLLGWLRLVDARAAGQEPCIEVHVAPPVELKAAPQLTNGKLAVGVMAHAVFDRSKLHLAIRSFPDTGFETRQQVATEIKWEKGKKGVMQGTLHLSLEEADSALLMLTIGRTTLLRCWVGDPSKAQNDRLVAVQHFDKDLKMLRQALFDSPDQNRFELGVASIFFLQGFSPAVQIETDSPDLIVLSPSGTFVLVECTTRIADFPSKVGKLVDRREALRKVLTASKHTAKVDGFLICRLPKDQIAAAGIDLPKQKITLLAQEDLLAAIDSLRTPLHPDAFLENAANRASGWTESVPKLH